MSKKKDMPINVFGVQVIRGCYSSVTREATGDKWDADDIAHDYTTHGVRPTNKEECADIVTSFPVEKGGMYFLVSVTHSDGDSFHSETGLVEYVDLFKTKKEAQALATAISKKYHAGCEGKSFDDDMNLHHNGKSYYVYQWSGYFNRLESVNVEEVHYIERN